jgi:hypothetical protein
MENGMRVEMVLWERALEEELDGEDEAGNIGCHYV